MVGGQPSDRSKLARVGQILALAGVYVVLGKLGMAISSVSGFATLVWPGSGIALAALLLGGYRLWPGIALGALGLNLWLGAPPLVACFIAMGNTLEAVVGAFALRRIPGFRCSLERFQDVVGLAVLAAGVSPLLGATIGVTSLTLSGTIAAADFTRTWIIWWAGDLASALVVAPVLLTWARRPRLPFSSARLAEVAAIGVLLILCAGLVFGQGGDALARNLLLRPYLLFIPLIWAALRFGVRGAATGMLLVATIAVGGTYTGHGAFVRMDQAHSLLLLHAFLVATSLTTLALGAVVSERERSRRLLNESQSLLLSIVNGTSEAIYAKDMLGRYVLMNAAGARLLDLPSEAFTGKEDFALFTDAEARLLRETDQEVMRTGRAMESEEHLTIGGQPRVYHTTKTPYRDQSGNLLGVIGSSRDITERREIEKELGRLEERQLAEHEHAELLARERAARAEAQAAVRAKDEFLAVVSHELRTPLQSMLGWAQILREKRVDERMMQKGLETIERNVKTQAQLIEDLLDISRVVTGTIRLDRQPIHLGPVVDAALTQVMRPADAKSIHVEASLDPYAGQVLGDPGRLEQVVSNLLLNAVKFTPNGGRVGMRLERDGATVRIVVEDSGCGISPEFLPHVFDRFRQADSTTTRSHGGLGLGLSIVHHLVALHGGTVTAESAGENHGATFTVTLPLLVETNRIPAARSPRAPTSSAPTLTPTPALIRMALDGVRVLMVDDDPDACELLTTVLLDAGAEVRAAHSTREALRELVSFSPHLLLSDIGMPGEDGYALLRQVRARESTEGGHVPAVALTAFASLADREEALSLGFEEHIAKPVSTAELIRTVATLVGKTL